MCRKFFIYGLALLFVCGLTVNAVSAQIWASYNTRDTTYIKLFPHKWTVRPFILGRTVELELSDINTASKAKDKKVTYMPNTTMQVGIFAAYKRMGLGASIAIPGVDHQRQKFGRTNYFDLDLNFYSRRIVADFAYFNYRGFYNSNVALLDPSWKEGMPYPQRPDLRLVGGKLNVIYIFNYKKFSLKASFQQLEKQTRSAGSFLGLWAVNYTMIRSDSSLIPGSLQADMGNMALLTSGKFSGFSFAPGYGHVWKWRKWSINPVLFVGLSIQGSRVKTETEKPLEVKGIGAKINGRISVHYDTDRFFTGFFFIADAVHYTAGGIKLNQTSGLSCFFAGYRF